MQGKLSLAVGFVAGYVLGSKAGRQRYEEIVAQARKLAGSQTVQSTAGVLQTQASDLVNRAKDSDVVAKAKQAVGRGATDSGTSTYTPSTYADRTTPGAASADLFEPTTGTTTDPLAPRNPSGTN
ncbi:MAG TPA: hypothetical protein VFR35_07965, partial [Actinoplanes sp.]|nr:hypothetical protein [Actinoplanes sp.]